MNIYFLVIFYILCLALDIVIIKRQVLNQHNSESRVSLFFLILFLPSLLIVMKISNQYFNDEAWYLKVILSVLAIITFNSLMYLLIKKILQLK